MRNWKRKLAKHRDEITADVPGHTKILILATVGGFENSANVGAWLNTLARPVLTPRPNHGGVGQTPNPLPLSASHAGIPHPPAQPITGLVTISLYQFQGLCQMGWCPWITILARFYELPEGKYEASEVPKR